MKARNDGGWSSLLAHYRLEKLICGLRKRISCDSWPHELIIWWYWYGIYPQWLQFARFFQYGWGFVSPLLNLQSFPFLFLSPMITISLLLFTYQVEAIYLWPLCLLCLKLLRGWMRQESPFLLPPPTLFPTFLAFFVDTLTAAVSREIYCATDLWYWATINSTSPFSFLASEHELVSHVAHDVFFPILSYYSSPTPSLSAIYALLGIIYK